MKIGDIVEWTSQSLGFTTTKTGRIIEVIPPGTRMRNRLLNTPGHHGIPGVSPRSHESYLIEVPAPKGSKAMPRIYWPRVCLLKVVAPQRKTDGQKVIK